MMRTTSSDSLEVPAEARFSPACSSRVKNRRKPESSRTPPRCESRAYCSKSNKFARRKGPFGIACTKEKHDKYAIHIQKFEFIGKRQEKLEELEQQYVKFLEKLTSKYPYQFYHFYDFFNV